MLKQLEYTTTEQTITSVIYNVGAIVSYLSVCFFHSYISYRHHYYYYYISFFFRHNVCTYTFHLLFFMYRSEVNSNDHDHAVDLQIFTFSFDVLIFFIFFYQVPLSGFTRIISVENSPLWSLVYLLVLSFLCGFTDLIWDLYNLALSSCNSSYRYIFVFLFFEIYIYFFEKRPVAN